MKRPVWLFSLDTEQFSAVPMTTGRLKAYFNRFGQTADECDLELVHFSMSQEIDVFLRERWDTELGARARAAVDAGLAPVAAFSIYTWNAADFLSAIAHVRASCPGIQVIVGGPHVQRAQDFLYHDGIDVVVLGEGEATFQEWLDCSDRDAWASVKGLAYLDDGELHKTPERERFLDLDSLPSALDVIELRDAAGNPRYPRVAYETSRGCPFKCAFCEWGTGAIGTKMYQHGLVRVRSDFERLIAGGVQDIWLCDSNFGALREDLDKAKIIVELRERTGRPSTFATSWSKTHNERVQEIVLLLQRHGLLQHYNLALQTLTPLALKLSNRKNMKSNRYEPIAKAMAEQGVQIATELIWGLPGDTLAEFEQNLDRLISVFTNINIFGYTLLPGTEFFEKREEYAIQTIPVAGYGKAKGEYVVGCHTFGRDEGIEGYFLISGHIMLIRGYIMPLTARYLALRKGIPVSPLFRASLRTIAETFQAQLPHIDLRDRMSVYENRDQLYTTALAEPEKLYRALETTISDWLIQHGADTSFVDEARKVLAIDAAFCPRVGRAHLAEQAFEFAADQVAHYLNRMELPSETCFAPAPTTLRIQHPGGVGEVLKDPDGGSWFRGQVEAPPQASAITHVDESTAAL
ncbi:MAG TPA: radical SAM protein [Polyangiales bacterium]|nr:radical SAM protein [Polyangiales bacterium]